MFTEISQVIYGYLCHVEIENDDTEKTVSYMRVLTKWYPSVPKLTSPSPEQGKGKSAGIWVRFLEGFFSGDQPPDYYRADDNTSEYANDKPHVVLER